MVKCNVGVYLAAPYNMVKVADVVEDQDLDKHGNKARQTEIKFVSVVDKYMWTKRSNWCYIIAIDGFVEKIGGTAAGLKDRAQSYLCGTEAYRRAGTCATTNYICYQAMKKALMGGSTVEVFAVEISPVVHEVQAVGQKFIASLPVYHMVETHLLDEYSKLYGSYPTLSQKAGRKN